MIDIEKEFNSFIAFPEGSDKQYVTSISAVLFAKHCIQQEREEIDSLNVKVLELKNLLKRVVYDIEYMADHSNGVDGLHLNGDVALWDDLMPGGNIEGWLSSVHDAKEALKEFDNE